MVTGMPQISPKHDGICKGCALGKNTKKLFSRSNNRSKGILDLIHSDICGPMSSPSLSGYLYNDHSQKSWIKEFKALIENHTGIKTEFPKEAEEP